MINHMFYVGKGEIMRSIFIFVSTTFILLSAALANPTTPDPIKELSVGVNGVYIPSGFTNKAEAYVVVNGLFPNSCYTLIDPKVKHISTFNHEIMTMASVRQGICLRVLVPFKEEISIGKLSTGVHTLRFVADDGTAVEEKIEIP